MDAVVKNVLADRYASPEINAIWSESGKILTERSLWIAILKAQSSLGIDIPDEAIASYEAQKDVIDLDSIRKREQITRHDVKARIDEFCSLAAHEHIHKGMTSRDLTENVEQLQVFQSLKLILNKSVYCLKLSAELADKYRDLVITGRSHNVPAQPTTLGKKLAMYGEEFSHALKKLEELISTFPARGLKGAVGTQTDQLTLFDGDATKAEQLDRSVCDFLGIPSKWTAVGQVYPRSLDFEVISNLYQLTAGPSNFSRMVRLMAGHETASEGFAKGQTGSSAMPHKMNSRSCERIHGFRTILSGHVTMAGNLAGDQWHEGDVSCSVVRRVLLPDAFFAIDGLLNTWISVMKQMVIYPAMIEDELSTFAPFLMTTTLMMHAVKKGLGRETAHELIKEHAVATIESRRKEGNTEDSLVNRLAGDTNFPLDQSELETIVSGIRQQIGNADQQTDAFLADVQRWLKNYPEAEKLETTSIL